MCTVCIACSLYVKMCIAGRGVVHGVVCFEMLVVNEVCCVCAICVECVVCVLCEIHVENIVCVV